MSEYHYFADDELTCRCGCGLGASAMSRAFMLRLEFLRKELGFPFPVTSAIRCSKHNVDVSSTGKNGIHTTGKAVDIAVDGEHKYELVKLAMFARFTGIGIGRTFVHLDIGSPGKYPRPRIWNY
jgi:uncharacterized protein YcbK (DUF882 family)